MAARAGRRFLLKPTRPIAQHTLYAPAGPVLPTVASGSAREYAYENVGIELTIAPDGREYAYENVGIELAVLSLASEYAYLGDVYPEPPFVGWGIPVGWTDPP